MIGLFRPPEENRQTTLERQIDYCLSMNYERVREQLKRLDTSRHGTVTANEIRSIVEDLINYTLKPDEYYQFLKQIPMDENGRVKYKQFLNQLLDRTLLVQEQQQKSSRSPQYEFTQPINPRDKLNAQQLKQKRTEKHDDSTDNFSQQIDSSSKARSIDEVHILWQQFQFELFSRLFLVTRNVKIVDSNSIQRHRRRIQTTRSRFIW